MPYINPQRRAIINRAIPGDGLSGAGELTYVLQQVVRNYLLDHGRDYVTMAEIIGALEGCKVDFERRVLAGYEESKRVENGDVW